MRWLWGNEDVTCEFMVAEGNAGGLISCWRNSFFSLELKVVAQRYILMVGVLKEVNFRCGLGNAYAPNDEEERSRFFEELGGVISNSGCPWVLGGDFNIVQSEEEKIGLSFNLGAMNIFSSFIEAFGFVDLPLSGGKFTWCNNRDQPTFCRLDHFLCSPEVLMNFSNMVQKLWPRSLSDHNPFSLESDGTNWGPKPFRFYNHWMDMEGSLRQAIKVWVKEKRSIDNNTISSIEEEILRMEVAVQSGLPWESVRAEKFEKKLSGWKASHLSMSGRCVLINSVLASLPIYFMSLFQIPEVVKIKIDRIQKRFLWRDVNKNWKIHWVGWESICLPKKVGGLGFVDLRLKNRTLLNKWIWRFGIEKEALWRKVIIDKYGGDYDALLPELRNFRRFSGLWRNISKPLVTMDDFATTLLSGMGFSLGNDKVVWKRNASGKYSPRSFYDEHYKRELPTSSDWSSIWAGLFPPKIELFCWKVLKGRVAVKVELATRNALHGSDLSCPMCGIMEESVNHLFFQCRLAWSIWMPWSAI
ncbi:hypothetical protein PTKIN_Ptkin16aG0012400 [Pterospermum kingtungense]